MPERNSRRKFPIPSCGHAGTALSALLAITTLSSCAVNPATGERELALISESQEIEMGREAADDAAASMGIVEMPELNRYVSDLGQRLAAASERPNLPWRFQVVDDPTPNAFALPGGFIFVTRGLLGLLDSEAELVAVLGHEIGHVTARHSVSQISRAQLAQLGLGVGAIAAPEKFEEFGQLASSGLGLLFLKHGRDDERQADQLGFNYMTSRGFAATEMVDVFAALDASSGLSSQSPTPAWLSTHPSGPERIDAVRERISTSGMDTTDGRIGANEYLEQVNGLVYGKDPRQGFFQDGYFYHPDLQFSLLVPSEWRKQDTRSAVMAASPAEDAAMQLTLPNEPSTEAATAAFFATPEITDLGSQRRQVNGKEAVVSRFSAGESGSSRITGIAVHLEHDNSVYRLLVYAQANAFANYQGLAENITTSFGTLTDQEMLSSEPKTIRIVEIEERMSLAQFNQRHPSSISIDELAVINQLAGAQSMLAPGRKLKRII